MARILKDIPNSEAAALLREERVRLTRERIQLAGEIRERQQRLDAIDCRLQRG